MSTTKAVRVYKYGDSSTLAYEDAPKPTPKEDEVLIHIHNTTVNRTFPSFSRSVKFAKPTK